MTPFDWLLLAVVAFLVLVIVCELLVLRPLRSLVERRDKDNQLEPWIQVWPPDEHR